VLQVVRIFSFFYVYNCRVNEREVIEDTTYTRIIRLDGRGDLIFDNDRVSAGSQEGLSVPTTWWI
jgi:hypothetical protein